MKLTDTVIKALTDAGAKRWTKGAYDRIYVTAENVGLTCVRYNTGNVFSATLNGEKISNTTARQLLAPTCYIDVNTGALKLNYASVRECNMLKDLVEEFLNKISEEEN